MSDDKLISVTVTPTPMAIKTMVKIKKMVARFLAKSGPTDDLQ
jgi:hypothetical protein